jgi:hypothetical protein
MLSAEERRELERQAADAGVGPSAYLRRLIAGVTSSRFHSARAEGRTDPRAIRSHYVRELVALAETVDRAVLLYRQDRADDAVRLALDASGRCRAVGKMSRTAWLATLADHAGSAVDKRRASTRATTDEIILSIIEWNERGAYPPNLADGKPLLLKSAVARALDGRARRRRAKFRDA